MADAMIVRPRPLPNHTTRFSLWRVFVRKPKNPFVKRFKRLVPDRAAGGMFFCFSSCPFVFFSERSERVVDESADYLQGDTAGKRLKIPR